LMERLDDPLKNWKFEAGDLDERDRWHEYMRAYEQTLSKTSTKHAPWYIIPADHKWFTRIAIADGGIEALESLDLGLPKMTPTQLDALAAGRKRLEPEP